MTAIRLQELENETLVGHFDFNHLKAIHRHIFQDVYDWAGEVRQCELAKGNNIFCTLACIEEYSSTVFDKYYAKCYSYKDDFEKFVRVFADNYGDLNALHPFREGNGRTQREFARLICFECGYEFNLNHTTHKEMLEASIYAMNEDSSKLAEIFKNGITPIDGNDNSSNQSSGLLSILTSDDMTVDNSDEYNFDYEEHGEAYKHYLEYYQNKIGEMKASVV